MMFSKKMFGSCCVGFALLLSSEGFGLQKEYTVGSGKSAVKITEADIKDGIDAYDVYDKNSEGKYVKDTHGVYALDTQVAIDFAQGKQYFDVVDGYHQAIAGFERQTCAAHLVLDIACDVKKGIGTGNQDAMHKEVKELWPAVEIAAKIIGHKDNVVTDLVSAQQFAQLVTDVVAGNWEATTANADLATDKKVKEFINNLKTAANAKTATVLQGQGVCNVPNEDAVRVQLLHAKLAGKSVDDIKEILDN